LKETKRAASLSSGDKVPPAGSNQIELNRSFVVSQKEPFRLYSILRRFVENFSIETISIFCDRKKKKQFSSKRKVISE